METRWTMCVDLVPPLNHLFSKETGSGIKSSVCTGEEEGGCYENKHDEGLLLFNLKWIISTFNLRNCGLIVNHLVWQSWSVLSETSAGRWIIKDHELLSLIIPSLLFLFLLRIGNIGSNVGVNAVLLRRRPFLYRHRQTSATVKEEYLTPDVSACTSLAINNAFFKLQSSEGGNTLTVQLQADARKLFKYNCLFVWRLEHKAHTSTHVWLDVCVCLHSCRCDLPVRLYIINDSPGLEWSPPLHPLTLLMMVTYQ